jgi:hypothetical protein
MARGCLGYQQDTGQERRNKPGPEAAWLSKLGIHKCWREHP